MLSDQTLILESVDNKVHHFTSLRGWYCVVSFNEVAKAQATAVTGLARK